MLFNSISLLDFLSTCSINNLEIDVKIVNSNCGCLAFFYISVIFLLYAFENLLLGVTDFILLLLLSWSILLLLLLGVNRHLCLLTMWYECIRKFEMY